LTISKGRKRTRYASRLMGGIGITELLVVLGIVLVIFGGRRLPQLGRDLGSGMREFKDSVTGRSKAELPERTGTDDPADAAAEPGARDQAEPVVEGEVVRDRS